MKYMTYELLACMQSADEEAVDRALVQWERACEAYIEHLARIRRRLPSAASALLDGPSLHDASFAAFGLHKEDDDGEASAFIGLQLDSPANQGLRLDYKLAGPIKVIPHERHPKGDAELLWLYDELDVVEVSLAGGGKVPIFTHSVLLSEGTELRVAFWELSVTRYKNLLSSGNGLLSAHPGEQRELVLS